MSNDKIAAIFLRVFSTEDGKRVLEHLEKSFPEQTELLTEGELRYFTGTRKVITSIHKLINKGRG